MATSDVTDGLIPDSYGQLHPVENDEMIANKLELFEEELTNLPNETKKSLKQAEEKCPDQLTKDFKLRFLRSEVFNADLAAKRYCSYWDKRIEICGEEKAFLPFTLGDALKDDEVAVNTGFMKYLAGSTDPMGRGVIFIQPANQDKTKYTRESMCRAVWYMIHAASEKPEAQMHGIIFVIHPKGAKLSQFDRGLMKLILPSIQGVLPVRLTALHICQPPGFIKLILPFAKLFMSERTKKRLNLHFGSDEDVRAKLQSHGLPKESVPETLGGDAKIDITPWIEQRRAEGK